jgi:hypothetical protein
MANGCKDFMVVSLVFPWGSFKVPSEVREPFVALLQCEVECELRNIFDFYFRLAIGGRRGAGLVPTLGEISP